MNALNLNRLNVNAPYSVWQVSDDSYGFKTDFGVLYRVAFTRDQTIWEEDAYEFAILNENQKTSPSDKNLRETVFCLIEEFFLNVFITSDEVVASALTLSPDTCTL